MVRVIVTSQTYKRTSTASPELVAADPYNREFARQSPFRLDAELVRDMADVRALVVECTRKTDVKVCSEDSADKPAENELGEMAIAQSNVAARRDEVEQHPLAICLRSEEVLHCKRKIL